MKMKVAGNVSQINVAEESGSQVITQYMGINDEQRNIQNHLDHIRQAIEELGAEDRARILEEFNALSSEAYHPAKLLEGAQRFRGHLRDAVTDYAIVSDKTGELIEWLASVLHG